MATDRYKRNKPINDYEIELFSRLKKNNQQDIPQKAFSSAWNRYDYDIVPSGTCSKIQLFVEQIFC